MQILFIGDDPEDYELFCDAMKAINPNINCIFKANGAVGLLYLQQGSQPPDYIFLDLNMPVMGGHDCLRQIKADVRLKNIPVIIYSSVIDPSRGVKYYQNLGAVHFMQKPSSYREIVDMLQAFFGSMPNRNRYLND